MENTTVPNQGKIIAIVAYITFIGWIIAFIMHGGNKTSLGAYHLRQSLGLMLLAIIVTIVRVPLYTIPVLGWGIGMILSLGVLAFWIIGLVSAVNAEEKPVPLLGKMFQNWFASIGR